MAVDKKELHKLIDLLKDEDVEVIFPLLKRIVSYEYEDEELSDEAIKDIEMAKKEIERGEYVDFDELKREFGLI